MFTHQICDYCFSLCVLCSNCAKKPASRTTAEQSEASHSSVNSSLTEAADSQSTDNSKLTPRALRYARRSGGHIEPENVLINNSGIIPSTSSQPNKLTSASARRTDVRGESSRKRSSTDSAPSETPRKKARKEPSKSTPSSNTGSLRKSKQEPGAKKQDTRRRSSKSTVVCRKPTLRQTVNKTSNLDRGKEKAARGDKASSKASAGPPSLGATGRITTKKPPPRSAAAASAGSETSLNTGTGETAASASTSQNSQTVTRRAATKRVGALLSSSGHLTDTTGSCASSKYVG